MSEWLLLNNELVGSIDSEQLGFKVDINSNGDRIAMTTSDSGNYQVKIYENNNLTWTQVGSDINIRADRLSLNGIGNVVAFTDQTQDSVYVYHYINNEWVQKGNNLTGDITFGTSIDLDYSGDYIAVGDWTVNNRRGVVKVFQYVNNNWIQYGSDINGDQDNERSGYSLAINADASIVIVGSIMYTGSKGLSQGRAKVYEYNNGWSQKGRDLVGDNSGDLYGEVVSISDNGQVIAVGSQEYNNGRGMVRLFNYGSDWTQIGSDIVGHSIDIKLGISIQLNSDGSRIVIGYEDINNQQLRSGEVRIYENINNVWTQIGSTLTGDVDFDRFGNSVGINNTGDTIVIGSYQYDSNSLTNNGKVSTYSYNSINLSNNSVNELNEINDIIGTFTTSVGSNHTYSLVSGVGDTDNTSFTISGSNLLANEVFDFETKNTYSIRVRSVDTDYTIEKVFAININDLPEIIYLSNYFIEEQNNINDVIGELSIGYSYSPTFSLVSGEGDTDNSSFTISGNNLLANEIFDVTTKKIYSVRVRATTSFNIEYPIKIAVTYRTITPTKEVSPPLTDNSGVDLGQYWHGQNPGSTYFEANIVFPSTISSDDKYVIHESGGTNIGAGTFIINQELVIVSQYTNNNELLTSSYDLSTDTENLLGNPGSLGMEYEYTSNKWTLRLYWNGTLLTENTEPTSGIGNFIGGDNEGAYLYYSYDIVGIYSGQKSSFVVFPNASRQGSLRLYKNNLRNDVVLSNDFLLSNKTINENNQLNDIVGTFNSLSGSVPTYTLVSGIGDTDNSNFSISSSNLVANAYFDYETKNSYSIRVKATGSDYSVEKVFTITINDVEEITISNNEVIEGNNIGDVIGTLTINGSSDYNFSLTDNIEKDNDSFLISGNELQAGEVFDFDTKNSYNIQIQAGTSVDTIEILGDYFNNNSITEYLFPGNGTSTNRRKEFVPNNGTKPNFPSSRTIDDSLYTFDLTNGNIYFFEVDNVYSSGFSVLLSDYSNGSYNFPPEDSGTNFISSSTDLAEYGIRFLGSSKYDLTYIKSNNSGVNTSDVYFSDFPDADGNKKIQVAFGYDTIRQKYTFKYWANGIYQGCLHDNSDIREIREPNQVKFVLCDLTSGSGGTGKITKTNYKIYKDNFYNESNLTTTTISLTTNINISITTTPVYINLSTDSIDENNSINDVIGTLSSSNSTNNFTLVSGDGDTDNSSFTISGSNLLANEEFDYETKNIYSIRIRDTGEETIEQQFTITINNINEAPSNITLNTDFIYENNIIGRNIGKFNTINNDGSTFTYSLIETLDHSSFTLVNNILKANVVFDYDTKNLYNIRIRSTNEFNLYYEKDFTINIYQQKENIKEIEIVQPVTTTTGVVIHEPDIPFVLDVGTFGSSTEETILNNWVSGNDNSGIPAIVKEDKIITPDILPVSQPVLKLVSPDNDPYIINGVTLYNTPEYLGVEQPFSYNVNGELKNFIYILVGVGSSASSIIPANPAPCFTNICNILTPYGYKNISFLKENDIVLTHDYRQVKIEKLFRASCCARKYPPRLIEKNKYGKNKPIIDTFLSENHQYKINSKWTKPKNEKLIKKWNDKIVTYYHIKLPKYETDHLIVNGIITESWDGKYPSFYKSIK